MGAWKGRAWSSYSDLAGNICLVDICDEGVMKSLAEGTQEQQDAQAHLGLGQRFASKQQF